MFQITRQDPWGRRTVRDLIDWVAQDPFFRTTQIDVSDEGTLALDVSETDGVVIVRASLPGFTRDDIDIQIHNGVLSIKAEHRQETEDRNEKFYRRERRVESVSRRIALPGVVAESEAEAELEDGVLTLRIPQTEDARPKHVEIK